MERNDEMIEIAFDSVIEERELAVCLYFGGSKKIWLPKSVIDYRSWSKIVGIPEWLAIQKGLL